MRESKAVFVGAAAALLLAGVGVPATAEGTADRDLSALVCTAAYQLDWQSTTSPERSAADRVGAERTYEALRANPQQTADGLNADIARQVAALSAQTGAGRAGLAEIVQACDAAWNGAASNYAAQYAPEPVQSSTGAADIVTFENAEPQFSASDSPIAASAECETTDRRAAGIMDTWTYALQDYYAGGVYDYEQERELRELYRSLRSRLEDEGSTAATYGCEPLASDIRHVLSGWENPF